MKRTKLVFRKALSMLLCAMLVLSTVAIGIVSPSSLLTVANAAEDVGQLAFYAPEAVYLYPNVTSWTSATATPFQYFITNTVNTSDIYSSSALTPNSGTATSDTIYFAYSKIKSGTTPSLKYQWIDKSGNVISSDDATINLAGVKKGADTTTTMTAANSYYTVAVKRDDSKSPSLAAAVTGCYIRWIASYVDATDGQTKEAYAYTYVYKPNVRSVSGAAKMENDRGTNSNAATLTWLTGIHSINAASSRYARYGTTSSGITGLAPFLSSENTAYIGGSSVSGIQGNAGGMYAVFASTDSSKAYFKANQSYSTVGDNWPGDWSTTNISDARFDIKSADEKESTEGTGTGDSYNYLNLLVSSQGKINVDTSRYSNLNQIPNLAVGMMVTDNKHCDNGAWIIGDYTGVSDYRSSDNGHDKNSGTNLQNRYNKLNSQTVFASNGAYESYNGTANAEGIKYAGTWNKAISSSSATYSFKSIYMNSDSDRTLVSSVIDLTVTTTNKTALRQKIAEINSKTAILGFRNGNLDSRYYDTSDDTWTAFINAYNAAWMGLTVVDESVDTSKLISNLESAANALKVKVTLNHNYGTASSSYKSFTVGLNNYVEYDVSEFGTFTRKGYTFMGWSDNSLATSGTTSGNMKVGAYYRTYYATWSLDNYTATFKALTYGKIGDNAVGQDLTVNYNVETGITIPATYSRSYYTFNDNWKVISTTTGDWSVGNLFAPGVTTDTGKIGNIVLEPATTPITYTADYDAAGGSEVVNGDASRSYNIESTHSLPTSVREGYTLVGWDVTYTDDASCWESGKSYPAGTSFNGKHGNVTFKANWQTLTSTITIKTADGESYTGNKTLSYAYASTLQVNTATKNGYTFKGWKVTGSAANSDGKCTWVIGETFTLQDGDTTVSIPGGRLGDCTLEPIWEKVTYTITFNSNGGTVISSKTYTIEDTVTLASPAKDGYTFRNWSVSVHDTADNWTATSYAGGGSVSGMYGNVTLIANYDEKAFTITLDANGGTVSQSTVTYKISNSATLPQPTKTGYDFSGWVVTAADSSAWKIGDVYTESIPGGKFGNVTLKATWTAKKYTITFSDGVDSVEYSIEDTVTLPSVAKTGYDFAKWTVTSSQGNWTDGKEYAANETVTGMYGDVIMTAGFTPISYSYTYLNTDGSTYGGGKYTIEDTLTPPSDYTAAGYIFNGWRVEQNDIGSWTVGNIIAPGDSATGNYGDVTFKPELEAREYTASFSANGGMSTPDITYTIESEDRVLPSTTRTGYDFLGWKITSGNDTNWDTSKVYATGTSMKGFYGNVTFEAQWKAQNVNITFVMGDKQEVVTSPYDSETPNVPASIYCPDDAQYTYTFDHWEPALSKVSTPATYTAVYTKTVKSYTITWKVQTVEGDTSSVVTTTSTVAYGDTPAYPDGVPSQTSSDISDHEMRFDSWTPEIKTVTGAATYTAVFKKVLQPQTVNWYNGTTLLASESWGVGDTPSWAGATPTKADENGFKFVFKGWSTTDGGEVSDPVTVTAAHGEYNYYAVFEIRKQTYILTFNANGGTLDENTSEYTFSESGAEATFPLPTKTGYTFGGWKLVSTNGTWVDNTISADGLYAGNTVYVVEYWGDASFEAQWTPTQYTLKFEGMGVSVDSLTYTIESDSTLPTAEKTGYEHTGWLVSVGDGSWIQGTVVATDKLLTGEYGNATVTPVYKAKTYTITWVSGEYTQTSEYTYGASIYRLEPVAKQGYTADWDSEVPATMPAEDITFKAVYTPVTYYLRLNLNGGTGAESFEYSSETDTVLPTPTRSGAQFLGWKVTSTAGNWTQNSLLPSGTSIKGKYGNTTLTAQWKLDSFAVTWVAGDTTKVTHWYYGMTPSYDGTPYKSPDESYSYVFSGWDKEITPVTGDVTYTALFDKTAREYTVIWNVDGAETKQTYHYGDTLVCPFDTDPVRISTSEYDFIFEGWTPATQATVTDDVVYTAEFRVFTKLLGLSLNKSALFLNIDESEGLSAEIYPSTASVKDVIWSSSNADVAKVDEVGKVTAVNAGMAIVSVASADGAFKSYCVVTVSPKTTTYVEITANGVSTTNVIGSSVQLYATVKPDDATDRTYRWTSDNPGIASVDDYGMVRFNSKGTTTIHVVTTDGYAQGSIEVTATEVETEQQVEKTYAIRFLNLACDIIVCDEYGNEHTFKSNEVLIVPEGGSITFYPTHPYYIICNGVTLEQDAEYTISNIQQNYMIASSKAEVITPDDDEDAKTFIQKLQEFFRKIVQFFKNLFKH
jgi:uncharacterized repeat protein (TIGR02543 family)